MLQKTREVVEWCGGLESFRTVQCTRFQFTENNALTKSLSNNCNNRIGKQRREVVDVFQYVPILIYHCTHCIVIADDYDCHPP